MRAILTYHSIDPSGSPISVDPDVFRRHVEWLAGGEVRVTTVAGLLAEPPDSQALALTFDDAFENFESTAWPLLRRHCLPVTLFVPTSHVGRDNAWSGEPERRIPTLPLLDWPALERLAGEGVTLGSHTRSHRDLRGLDPASLTDELRGGAEEIRQRTGTLPTVLAYPYGFADPACVAASREIYDSACGTEFRALGRDEERHLLPRLDAYYFQGARGLADWGSRRFRAYVALRSVGRRVRALVR